MSMQNGRIEKNLECVLTIELMNLISWSGKWDEYDELVSRRGYRPEKLRRGGSEDTGRIERNYPKERIRLCRQWWRWGVCNWNDQ